MLGVRGGIAVVFEEMEMARGECAEGGATSSNLECAALMGSWAGTGRTGVLCTV